ncbi:MAG: hypothetical protein R3Y04_00090 [Rikenellaceae bacterium]
MKKFLKVGVVAVMSVLALNSCNCFKKVSNKIDTVGVSSSPAILSLKGSTVDATYTLDIPAKVFAKTAILKITPVLKYADGEIVGTPKFLQGEKVSDNYQVVAWSTPSKVTQSVSFDYIPAAKRSTLFLKVEAMCSKEGTADTSEEFVALPDDIFVAEGISTVQLLADDFAKLAIAPDNFKRITTVTEEAHIMYTINSAVVRNQALSTEELATLQNFIKENEGAYRRTVSNVTAKAYASPDGPLNFNDELSVNRGKSTDKAITSKFKKDDTPYKGLEIDALGEDWEGFKALVQASDIDQKDLILQILAMTSDPQKRDAEIKNLSAVFKVLAEKILPELRRSKLQVNVDIEGLSDDEIKAKVNGDINSLKLEELLYSATLFTDNATKAKVYATATKQFASDFRGWNNLGVILAREGEINEAKGSFAKAAQLNSSSNEVINNLGAVALFEGNTAEAKKYLSSISTSDSKYNMGLVNLQEGNYDAAVKVLNGYNLAVAEFCNGNISQAKSILSKEDSASASYLKAIIAAREGNQSGVTSNLEDAIAKDSSFEAKAKEEVEFINFEI